jgi:hypothetical protein
VTLETRGRRFYLQPVTHLSWSVMHDALQLSSVHFAVHVVVVSSQLFVHVTLTLTLTLVVLLALPAWPAGLVDALVSDLVDALVSEHFETQLS